MNGRRRASGRAGRLLGSIEALIGFLLIGWSTAFIVRTVEKVQR